MNITFICRSCKREFNLRDASDWEEDEEGIPVADTVICVNCRPPTRESLEMDLEGGYDGWLPPEDQYDD